MRNRFWIAALFLFAAQSFVGCSSKSGKSLGSSRTVASGVIESGLVSESDSLAYIVGMNVAEQLLKMDSTVNVGVVCRAIMEQFAGEAVMTRDHAREEYARYLLYVEPERRRSYEEKYLSDLVASDRSYTRTKTGLTYHISKIGDEAFTPRGANDWVTIRYTIKRVGGEVVAEKQEQIDALEDLLPGVEESVKMIGKGGTIEAWMPSKIAFGEEGSEELGVEPIETLFYSIELVDMERGAAVKRQKERDLENF